MTSIVDYVASCNEGQLETLIEQAQKKLKHCRSRGKVRLFGVFSSKDRAKWFWDRNKANIQFVEAARNDIGEKYPEVSLEKRLVYVEDLSEYFDEENVKKFLDTNPEIIKR